jgi:hypothetical protein
MAMPEIPDIDADLVAAECGLDMSTVATASVVFANVRVALAKAA